MAGQDIISLPSVTLNAADIEIGQVELKDPTTAVQPNMLTSAPVGTEGGLVTRNIPSGTQAVSLATIPSHPVTNAGTFPVQVTSAPTTPVTGTFFQANQPTSDTDKQSVLASAQILTASTTLAPPAGKMIKLVKSQVLQSPDNSTANAVTLAFATSGITFWTGWVGSDSSVWIGAVNEALTITLTTSQPVSVNLRYKLL